MTSTSTPVRCSANVAERLSQASSTAEATTRAEESQAPQDCHQLGNSQLQPHERCRMHTSSRSAVRAPFAREVSRLERGLVDPLPGDCPRRLHALARQGRRILDCRDAALGAEAAAAASDSTSKSVPWWRAWRQQPEHTQPSSSANLQPVADTAPSW
jgi:hypothetical protein